tara:strand:+ start:192 stop:794 length:603 start_codon:yes stop_codon:yes gene_type:complete
MYILGITGGIGSGKSTASSYLKNKGAVIFNADQEAKKHLKHTKILQNRIIDAFGQKVVEKNKLSLSKLAETAFSNNIDQKILNGLMWPEVFILVEKSINEAKENKEKLFVVDAAMIFEANFEHMFNSTLLILTRKKNRLERALKRKNLPLEQIQNRMSLQMPETEKKKKADYIINNDGTLENFYKKMDDFIKEINFQLPI